MPAWEQAFQDMCVTHDLVCINVTAFPFMPKTHFEENPRDLQVLRHDRGLLPSNQIKEHLKYIPPYLGECYCSCRPLMVSSLIKLLCVTCCLMIVCNNCLVTKECKYCSLFGGEGICLFVSSSLFAFSLSLLVCNVIIFSFFVFLPLHLALPRSVPSNLSHISPFTFSLPHFLPLLHSSSSQLGILCCM